MDADSLFDDLTAEQQEVLPFRRGLKLEILVKDPDAISALAKVPEGPERTELAEQALKIGLLALRQARGQIDAEAVKREGDRMLTQLQTDLRAHSEKVKDTMAVSLKEYFDPDSGRFQERVERLVKKDGDLEQLLTQALGADSLLGKTLTWLSKSFHWTMTTRRLADWFATSNAPKRPSPVNFHSTMTNRHWLD
jgi:hypothetical protein